MMVLPATSVRVFEDALVKTTSRSIDQVAGLLVVCAITKSPSPLQAPIAGTPLALPERVLLAAPTARVALRAVVLPKAVNRP